MADLLCDQQCLAVAGEQTPQGVGVVVFPSESRDSRGRTSTRSISSTRAGRTVTGDRSMLMLVDDRRLDPVDLGAGEELVENEAT
jgi:hypothetical protein